MKGKEPTIQVRWLTDKYSNFIKGKVYTATARMQYVHSKHYTSYYITDEDGDCYTLVERDLGKHFEIVK